MPGATAACSLTVDLPVERRKGGTRRELEADRADDGTTKGRCIRLTADTLFGPSSWWAWGTAPGSCSISSPAPAPHPRTRPFHASCKIRRRHPDNQRTHLPGCRTPFAPTPTTCVAGHPHHASTCEAPTGPSHRARPPLSAPVPQHTPVRAGGIPVTTAPSSQTSRPAPTAAPPPSSSPCHGSTHTCSSLRRHTRAPAHMPFATECCAVVHSVRTPTAPGTRPLYARAGAKTNVVPKPQYPLCTWSARTQPPNTGIRGKWARCGAGANPKARQQSPVLSGRAMPAPQQRSNHQVVCVCWP